MRTCIVTLFSDKHAHTYPHIVKECNGGDGDTA